MLLDTASLYFRAFYGVPESVKAPDGMPVNGIRGLLDIIAKLVSEFEPTELVACWDDDWRPRWRVDLIPSYKEHRVAEQVPGGVDVEETPAGLVPQIPVIRELLGALGIAVVAPSSPRPTTSSDASPGERRSVRPVPRSTSSPATATSSSWSTTRQGCGSSTRRAG
jgi:hypothetical protein